MNITVTQKTETIQELDFQFLGGQAYAVTLRPGLGDQFLQSDAHFDIIFSPKAAIPGSCEEHVTILKQNLLFWSEREREIPLVDPKSNPIAQRVAELAAKSDKQSAPSTTQS